MPLLTPQQTDKFLHEYYPLFIEIFEESFKQLQKHLKLASENIVFQKMHSRTKSTIMWDCAISYAIAKLDNNENVLLCQHKGAIGFLVKHKAFIRFKKLNKKLLSSNYPTDQATSMENQSWELPEIPEPPTILQVGYQVDETWSFLMSINIVCSKNRNKLWDIDVLNELGYTLDLFNEEDDPTDGDVDNFNLKPELKKNKKDGTNDNQSSSDS